MTPLDSLEATIRSHLEAPMPDHPFPSPPALANAQGSCHFARSVAVYRELVASLLRYTYRPGREVRVPVAIDAQITLRIVEELEAAGWVVWREPTDHPHCDDMNVLGIAARPALVAAPDAPQAPPVRRAADGWGVGGDGHSHVVVHLGGLPAATAPKLTLALDRDLAAKIRDGLDAQLAWTPPPAAPFEAP